MECDEEELKATKEKSADEMFSELGYEVKYQIYKDDVVIIGYTKENNIAEECPIMFLKKAKRVLVNNWIDMQELQVINKKVEELEWL